jgi:hypothetical protein
MMAHRPTALLLLLVGLAPISQASANARGDGSDIWGAKINIADVITGWNKYQDNILNIEGKLLCTKQGLCEFVRSPELSDIVAVDIHTLDAEEKRRLISGCRSPCAIIIRGLIKPNDIKAVWLWERHGMERMEHYWIDYISSTLPIPRSGWIVVGRR